MTNNIAYNIKLKQSNCKFRNRTKTLSGRMSLFSAPKLLKNLCPHGNNGLNFLPGEAILYPVYSITVEKEGA